LLTYYLEIMKFRVWEVNKGEKLFRMQEDNPEIGVYLFVYEGQKCTIDYLQNDVDICKEFAFDEFGIKIDSWTEVQ